MQKRAAPEPLVLYKKAYRNHHKAIAHAYKCGGYTMAEIALFFDVHYATVSRIVAKHMASI